MRQQERLYILIPAFEPNQTLSTLVHNLSELTKEQPHHIILVDDGSTLQESKAIFKLLEQRTDTTILTHKANQGKGEALKTGFEFFLQQGHHADYLVTADADGQHTPEDIFNVGLTGKQLNRPIIGVREFSQKVPLRSKLGNILTRIIFRFWARSSLTDTQSGLRAFSYSVVKELSQLKGAGYEFELNCLMHISKKLKQPFKQVKIKTIYEPGNPTSHFKPLRDSLKIYAVFFRYTSASALCSCLDIGFFHLFTLMNLSTIGSLLSSRAIALPLYFYLMRDKIFKSKGKAFPQLLMMLGLVSFNLVYLWQVIQFLKDHFSIHPTVAMVLGASIFYIGNFFIQRYIIFRQKSSNKRTPSKGKNIELPTEPLHTD